MAADMETFPMRYYYNEEFARGGEDVVVFVGGAWPISPAWARAGLAHELADWLGAGLFYTEHRYYGQTRPANDTSTPDLRFLNVDQALGDLAEFISYVKSDRFESGKYRKGSVVLIGCSYAGSVATWMRLAYPHLVDAVFSDSGPLLAQEDFSEHLEAVTEVLRSEGGEACVASVAEAVEQVIALLASANGPQQVSQMFNTCTTISSESPLDVATFFWRGVTDSFVRLVTSATPGDVTNACRVLTDPNVAVASQRLANWVTAQPWNGPCIETRYAQFVASHTDTSYDSPNVIMRLWTYQTCVEFGWYQTTTGSRHPFLAMVPVEYFHQLCKDLFGTYFDEGILRSGIERTNLLFGGGSPVAGRVVAVAGGGDPWTRLPPSAPPSPTSGPLYRVPRISHCRAIRPTGESETEELEAAKRAVINDVFQFLRGFPASSAARPLAFTVAIITLVYLIV